MQLKRQTSCLWDHCQKEGAAPLPVPVPVGPSGEKQQTLTQQTFLWTYYVPGTALSELITPSLPLFIPSFNGGGISINLSTLHMVSDLGCCNHLEDPARQH